MAAGVLVTHAEATPSTSIVYTFSYTGAAQYWTVPSGVTSVTLDVLGGAGGPTPGLSSGGLGGEATGGLTLTSGSTLQVNVGGAGGQGSGGWNGGGSPGNGYGPSHIGGGGGGSDIRTGAYGLSDRLLVAGGGGGGGYNNGGSGGGTTGGNGSGDAYDGGGAGGTQSAGGATGYAGCGYPGNGGTFGVGGNGEDYYGEGAGGGGWYGGGSGSAGCGDGGGGGGSGHANASVTSAVLTNGVHSGNGQISISYTGEILPTVTVSSTGTPALLGSVTYTATIAGLPTSPAVTSVGTVTFSDGGTAIPTCTSVAVSSLTATCTLTYATAGIHTITAAVSGNSGQYVLPATSGSLVQQMYTDKTTFSYTGAAQTWTVPTTASSAFVQAYGGAGGGQYPFFGSAPGGEAEGLLTLTSGSTLQINVGGAGAEPGGGWNGGGSGAVNTTGTSSGGGGGGASDVRNGAYGLADRLIVGGGGGGAGNISGGGVGGGTTGGTAGSEFTDTGGAGGTQSAGGAGGQTIGCFPVENGGNGTAGVGGDGWLAGGPYSSGGGGGGYFGGGAGANCGNDGAGGGGGSGYVEASATHASLTPAARGGNGQVIVWYDRAAQTVTFTAPSGVKYGDADSSLGATASSGLTVSYSSTTSNVCTIVAGKLHVVAAGSCTIDANQAGDANYSAAPQVEQTFTIATAAQTITLSAPSGVTYGDSDSAPGATASSGLSVSYSTTTASVCTIVSGKLHVVAAGSCTIDADQAGNGNYNAAPEVERTFTIAQKTLHVDATPDAKAYGASDPNVGGDYVLRASDLAGSDTAAVASGSPVCSLAAHAEDAGTYSGAITCTVGTLSAANYTFIAGSGADFTISQVGQTITFTAPSGATYGDADSDLGATASSGLGVSYSTTTPSVCSIVAGKLHIVAAGTCTVDANQAGDTDHSAAAQVERTFTVAEEDQTITFAAPAGVTYRDADSALGATAASGFSVSYSTTTPNVCTIVAGKLHVVAAGSCTVDANQAGDSNWNAAPQVELTFTIAQEGQTIAFTAPSGVTYGDPDFDLGATAGSGLGVDYSTTTPSVCTIAAGKLHIVGAGSCTVDANQAGNGNWNAAPQVERTFTIAKEDQAITFSAPSGVTYTSADFDPAATASSGFAVGYSTTTPGVCTIVSGKLHVVSPGSCTVDANQAGDGNWNAAPQVEQTFTIGKGDQAITFTAPSGVTYGDSDSALGATAASGLGVSYSTTTPSVCTIVSGQLHVVGAGSCTVDANQAGDGNWNAAPQVEQTFTIAQEDQTITFTAPTGVTYGDPDSDLGATAGSGLGVSYSTTTPSICTIVAGKLHIVSGGSCTVDANQAGNGNWNAAPQLEQTFTIGQEDQTITFTAPTGVTYGDPDFDLGATASSGLPVGYLTTTPSVCEIVNGLLHIVSAGTCSIRAFQAGNADWNGAPRVDQTFTIAVADQTISFAAPTGVTIVSPDFDPGATASSGLQVSYSTTTPDTCTIVAGELHMVALGSCTVDANQAGDGNYHPAPQVEQTFQIVKSDQTITFDIDAAIFPSLPYVDATFDPGATASSGLPVTYTSVTPDVCEIVSNEIHTLTAGVCTVDANQAGNGDYTAAAQVEQSFTMTKLDETIQFGFTGINRAHQVHFGADFDPQALAYPGHLPVTYSTTTPDVCTIVDGLVHLLGIGQCTVTADNAGNAIYNAARTGFATYNVIPGNQTITFAAPSGVTYASADFDPGATAASGLPVTYSTTTPDVCTIVDGLLHVVSTGTCTIDANQAGDTNWNAASQVEQTFTVDAGDQAIAFAAPGGVTYRSADFDLGATASSGLPVSYSTTTPSVCTIVAGELHVVAAGSCTVDADQAGDGNWNAAPEVERTFTIGGAGQTISFIAPSNITYGDADLDLGATASSGLTVSYSSTTLSVCTIAGDLLHVVSAGTCTVDADQAGDSNWNAAPQVEQTFTISQEDQRISFAGEYGITYGDADLDLGATSSSGLTVVYSSTTPDVCTIVNGLLHNVSAGSCTIDANQPGNTDWNAAPQVQRTLAISRAAQTITFAAPSGVSYGDADVDLGATASSGLSVSYSTTTPGVCTIVSGRLQTAGAGSCTVDANRAGNADYRDATEIAQTFSIGKATVHVDAVAATKFFGSPDPEPAAALRPADFQFDDTAATSGVTGTAACSIDSHSESAGTYDVISCGPGTLASPNYAFAAGTGAALAITAEPTPVSTALPTIAGTAQSGELLTATQGTWQNDASSIADQWESCDETGANCVPIAGATGLTYRLASSDAGLTIRVQETAGNSTGPGTPALSSPTALVAPAAPAGSTGSMTSSSDSADGTASASVGNAGVTADGAGSFTLAQYSSQPTSAPAFAAAGAYFDVHVAPNSSFSTMQIEECGVTEDSVLLWFDGHTWAPVTPQVFSAGPPPACVTATLSKTSSPTIDQLTGTVMSVAYVGKPSAGRVTARGAHARVPVRCFGAAHAKCTVSLTLAHHGAKLAGKTITLSAGGRKTAILRLDRLAKRLLADHRTTTVTLTVTQLGRAVSRRTIALRLARR